MCGSKTYQCESCTEYVKFMHKATHVSGGVCERNKKKKQ